jgi:release factor glutamine methyltransferase
VSDTIDVAGIARRLATAGCVATRAEAEQLLAVAADAADLENRIRRRESGEPLPWITGTVTFCGRPIAVDAGVYVPRPQTELLARRAEARLPRGGRAADLCCGCAAIAAHLARTVPSATIVGVDIDLAAVRCARRNDVAALVGDLDCIRRPPAGFDLVTAVPPYVPTASIALLPADVQRHEPRRALDGGADGLDVARRVVATAARLLRPGGWLLIELGGDQDDALEPTLVDAGFDRPIERWYDDDGDLRGIAAPLRSPHRRPGVAR